jgi:NADH-quinone oxidoreductase subunit N
MHTDWLGLLPVLILAAGGTIIFGAGALKRERSGGLLFALALLSVLTAVAAAALVELRLSTSQGMVDLGGYARFFTLLLLAIALLTLLFVRQYAETRSFAGDEFYALLLFAVLGMVLVASALNWVIFFLGLELLSLALYVLIAIRKDQAYSNEAGLKYLILGAVASGFFTFGIALLYAMSGTLQITGSLTAALFYPQRLPGIILALALILAGIGFKLSLVPFHLWTPDVYEGAPAPVTAFLSTGSKVALFAALLRFSLLVAAPVWDYCWPALWVLAVLTMAVGNLTALYQTRIKRLLAYSSVAQMGYLFMTLLSVKQGGLPALMFYLTVYAVMDLGAFGLVGAFSAEDPDLETLEAYRGLGYTRPWRAGILAVCLISLAGLPPTAGFMGKFVLFRAVLHANYPALAVIGILTVIISIYFYLKVVVSLYMHPPAAGVVIPGADPGIRVAGALILLAILWLGIMPSPLLTLIGRLVAALPSLS